MITTTAEFNAAVLEADQANRDFMNAWLTEGRTLDNPHVQALRYYRGAAERLWESMIVEQIEAICPAPEEAAEPEHVDYPHWPGTLHGCEPCERQMQEEWEREYDTREYES